MLRSAGSPAGTKLPYSPKIMFDILLKIYVQIFVLPPQRQEEGAEVGDGDDGDVYLMIYFLAAEKSPSLQGK